MRNIGVRAEHTSSIQCVPESAHPYVNIVWDVGVYCVHVFTEAVQYAPSGGALEEGLRSSQDPLEHVVVRELGHPQHTVGPAQQAVSQQQRTCKGGWGSSVTTQQHLR